jgi:hypothetical protein
MTIDSLSINPLKLDVTINNKPDDSQGKVTILHNYYPGWVAIMDGKTRLKLSPTDEGMIYLYPELGVHNYKISIKSTRLESISNLISLGSIIGLIAIWQKNRKSKNQASK